MPEPNDFKSLSLGPAESIGFYEGLPWLVYREIEWSSYLKRNGSRVVRRPQADEILVGRGIIRNPLTIDGHVYNHPGKQFVYWDNEGNFRGFLPNDGFCKLRPIHEPIVLDYVEKYMGLHNIDWTTFEKRWL